MQRNFEEEIVKQKIGFCARRAKSTHCLALRNPQCGVRASE
jgi:hypothetical protein